MRAYKGSKATIQNQRFRINLTVRSIDVEHATQAIVDYMPSSTISTTNNAMKEIADYLERLWLILALEREGENALTLISTPELAFEDLDEFLYLVEELKKQGAQGGKGCGMKFFACIDNQPKRAVINLRNIVASKSLLLEKALQCVFAVTEPINADAGHAEVIPCNVASNLDIEEMKACIQLQCAISAQAINQKRASGEILRPENEKYAFRCWLNRIGLKSNEYKPLRMLFLKRLEGDSSYKGGRSLSRAS